ncbi:MAG: dTDP-4-dehydrorhamnose reductase [Bacteroidales bacterium]
MYNVLITGANGQLGNELRKIAHEYPSLRFTWTDLEELDISSPEIVNEFLQKKPQDLIINCAAYTAVDKAESDPANAFLVNSSSVKILADAAQEAKAGLLHVSTDFVFDGKKSVPYTEDDQVNPLSVYGKSKLEGEMHALKAGIVIRTSWLYSAFGNNFLKTILRLGRERKELGIVFDQVGTPTHAADLASTLLVMVSDLHKNPPFPRNEIYHFSNEGVCSWYDFALEIVQKAGLDCMVKPIETSGYPTPAVRPAYSVLNKKKIKDRFNLVIPHWKESLHQCMKNL